MNQPKKLYSKQYDSYCTWNGTAYENDGKVPGAYFYGLEKAKNNGFLPIEENIYLNRLKEQYKALKDYDSPYDDLTRRMYYGAMRLFCLDTDLLSFNDIELMEFEVNQSF